MIPTAHRFDGVTANVRPAVIEETDLDRLQPYPARDHVAIRQDATRTAEARRRTLDRKMARRFKLGK